MTTQDNTEVILKATDTSDKKQIITYDRGTLSNPDTNRMMNENEGKLKAHWNSHGADSWQLEFDGSDGSSTFERLTYDKMRPSGAWPFNCDKIIPCNTFEGQTCGCSDEDGTNPKAIVYFLGSGSKMSDKLDFKSCQDLKDNGNVFDGDFKIGGSNKYCSNDWGELILLSRD